MQDNNLDRVLKDKTAARVTVRELTAQDLVETLPYPASDYCRVPSSLVVDSLPDTYANSKRREPYCDIWRYYKDRHPDLHRLVIDPWDWDTSLPL